MRTESAPERKEKENMKLTAEIKDTGYQNTCFIIQMLLKMHSY